MRSTFSQFNPVTVVGKRRVTPDELLVVISIIAVLMSLIFLNGQRRLVRPGAHASASATIELGIGIAKLGCLSCRRPAVPRRRGLQLAGQPAGLSRSGDITGSSIRGILQRLRSPS